MKSPEELSVEYAETEYPIQAVLVSDCLRAAFLAGYQAAALRWTSVNECPPESSDSYILVTQEHRGKRQVEYAKFKDGAWYVSGPGKVTHWMPLPTPPEEA